MRKNENGMVILESIDSPDAEERVLAYLGKLFGNVPPGWIGLLVKRTPALLIEDIPAPQAMDLVIKLKELGATATFSPSAPYDTPEEPSKRPIKPLSFRAIRTNKKKLWIYSAILLIIALCAGVYFSLHHQLFQSPGRPDFTLSGSAKSTNVSKKTVPGPRLFPADTLLFKYGVAGVRVPPHK